jgi:hypothetical protein
VRRLNDGKEWSEQVKPFNFLNMLTGDATLHSSSALVAPYSVDTRNVSDREWFSYMTEPSNVSDTVLIIPTLMSTTVRE